MVERLGERLVVTVEDRLLDVPWSAPGSAGPGRTLMPTGVPQTPLCSVVPPMTWAFYPDDPVFAPVDTTRKGYRRGCVWAQDLDATVAEAPAAAMRVGLALAEWSPLDAHSLPETAVP
jgi:hypothetical protein